MSKLQVFLVLFCCLALAGCGSSSASPKDTDSTSPKDADSTFPKDTDSTSPKDADSTFPKDTDSTSPKDADSTLPKDTDSTSPKDADSTSPKDFESTPPEEANPCTKLAAGELALSFGKIKTLSFCWQDKPDATYYQLLEDPDSQSGYTQVGKDIKPNIQAVDHIVPLYARVNARYLLKSCNVSGCSESASVHISERLSDMTASIGYLKASNAGASDYEYFGNSVSLSADGDTLAVGASGEGSSAKGINGGDAELNNGAQGAGAVYVFTHTETGWSQQAYIKASNTDSRDAFGHAVSLSANGNTLAVGAPYEDSNATGINGGETAEGNNDLVGSGAAYVFTRTETVWSQQAYIKASNTGAGDQFGYSVSLSADGNTLAVSATYEDSSIKGINGKEDNDRAGNSGAVYVFARIETDWSQEAYIKASNTDENDYFGYSVSLGNDGDILAVGAPNEDGEDVFAFNSGAVYVFARIETDWSQQAYIKASNTDSRDAFGHAVSLSKYGNILAVGARREGSDAKGINGNEKNDDKPNSGAVYVFARIGTDWSQQAYIKASNTDENDYFGDSVSLDADGNTLAVGAISEDSDVKGINGDNAEGNNSMKNAGAVYVFTLTQKGWSQQAYIKASNTDENDYFGDSVSLDADGNTLAVGAISEDSDVKGINGDQTNNTVLSTGAVYVY